MRARCMQVLVLSRLSFRGKALFEKSERLRVVHATSNGDARGVEDAHEAGGEASTS